MPRKSRSKTHPAGSPADQPTPIESVMATVAERHGITTADRLPSPAEDRHVQPPPGRPPEPEPAPEQPLHERNGKPGHAERARPTGPRKRDFEDPRVIYTGPNIEITLDGGDTINIASKAPLTGQRADWATAAGFDAVPDSDEMHWQADKRTHMATGKDINVLAIMLDGKGERLAQGRGR